MAYGDRNGVRKLPDEIGVIDMFGFGLAAAFGIAAATFFDLTQSDEASALFVFNKWIAGVSQLIGIGSIPLYGVVLILMAIGAATIFVFQPMTLRGAFVQGFGALAAVTTLAPSDLGQSLPAPGDVGAAFDELQDASDGDVWGPETELEGISGAPGRMAPTPISWSVPAAAAVAAAPVQDQGYSIRLQIVFPEGLGGDAGELIRTGDLRGRLHNMETKETFNLFRSGGANLMMSGDTIRMRSLIPGDGGEAVLVARIEAEGYAIAESRFTATPGANPVWTIRMEPSNTPLLIQRLRQPYWF